MLKPILALSLLFLIPSMVQAHGGAYRGPGGSGVPTSGDTASSGGASSGGSTAGASGTRAPGGTRSSASGPVAPGRGVPATAPTPFFSSADQVDPTTWALWWAFNKEAYLELKGKVHARDTRLGWLGRGNRPELTGSRLNQAPTEDQVRKEIVPALLAVLSKESNNDIITGCLIALAKVGEPVPAKGASKFEPVIAAFLADRNQEIRETAAVALGILARDDSVEALGDLLKNTARARTELVKSAEVDYRTRSFAAYGLGLIGARTQSEAVRQEIVELLAGAIDADDTASRDLQVACIISLGLVPLQTIGTQAQMSSQDCRPWDSRMAELRYLESYLADDGKDHVVRAHCPTALTRLTRGLPPDHGRFWRRRVADTCIALTANENDVPNELLQSAVLALGDLGGQCTGTAVERIRSQLRAMVQGASDQQARHFAMIALARASVSDPEPTAKFLVGVLEHGAGPLQPWAGVAIGVLARELQDAGVPQGAHPPEVSRALEALRRSLRKEKNLEHLGAYALAVGICRDPESSELLREHLDSVRQEDARGYVAVALGLLEDDGSVEGLRTVVERARHRPDLLKQAAIGLALLGHKDAVSTLVEMLSEAKGMSTQAALSAALGLVGDTRAVTPLVEMLTDAKLGVGARAFASVALGLIADKEPLPWNFKIAVNLNYRASPQTLVNPRFATGILDIF